jgi:hypothetical protein
MINVVGGGELGGKKEEINIVQYMIELLKRRIAF